MAEGGEGVDDCLLLHRENARENQDAAGLDRFHDHHGSGGEDGRVEICRNDVVGPFLSRGLPAQHIGLEESGEGELVEQGILFGDTDAGFVEVAAKDLPGTELFGGQCQDPRTASEIDHRPLPSGGTKRGCCLHEQLEASGRGGVVTGAEGHAAWDQ